MSGGRPTKYTPELIEKAHNYLEVWSELGDMIPSHEALSIYLDITRKTLYEWAKDEEKQEFCDILDKILVLQRQELINKGLGNVFNSAITKLVLGKHGFSDKVESDLTTKGEKIKADWHIHPVTTKNEG